MFIYAFDSSSLAHLDGSDIVWFVQENTRTGELRYPDGKPENGRHKRDVTNNPSRLWPNGIVHYALDSKILSDSKWVIYLFHHKMFGSLHFTVLISGIFASYALDVHMEWNRK